MPLNVTSTVSVALKPDPLAVMDVPEAALEFESVSAGAAASWFGCGVARGGLRRLGCCGSRRLREHGTREQEPCGDRERQDKDGLSPG